MLTACVFCCQASRDSVSEALAGHDVRIITDWLTFADAALEGAVLVVVLDLMECVPVSEVEVLRLRLPGVPFLLCAPRGLRTAETLDFDRSVHRGDLRKGLGGLIRHHQLRVARARVRKYILDGDHDLVRLREPVAQWLAMESPPHLASTAARVSRRSLDALEKAFRAEVRQSGATVKRCIDGIVVYRACEHLAKNQTLRETVRQMGLSTRTLRRMTRRAWAMQAADLRGLSPAEAVELLLNTLGLRSPGPNASSCSSKA